MLPFLSENISLLKKTRLTETITLELGAEVEDGVALVAILEAFSVDPCGVKSGKRVGDRLVPLVAEVLQCDVRVTSGRIRTLRVSVRSLDAFVLVGLAVLGKRRVQQ